MVNAPRTVDAFPVELQLGMRLVRVLASRALLAHKAQGAGDPPGDAGAEPALLDLVQLGGRLATLRTRLGLRPNDELALFIAMALEHDPLAALTLIGLLGEEPRFGVTARLVALVSRFGGVESVELGLGPDHPLVRGGILEETGPDDVPATIRGYRLASRATAWLTGADDMDLVVERIGGVVLPVAGLEDEVPADRCTLIERILTSGDRVALVIEGAEGIGRRSLAATAIHQWGGSGVMIDAGRLSIERSRALRELRALRRECWLRDAVPVLARLDAWGLAEAERGEVLQRGLAPTELAGPIIITCTVGGAVPELGLRTLRISLDPVPPPVRVRTWWRAIGDTPYTPELEPEIATIAARYALGPGAIRRVIANALVCSGAAPIGAEAIHGGLATELQSRFGGLATRISVTQRWDDLVLPADTSDEIQAFVARTRHAARVYDQWGFRDKLGRGLGLAALFSGPPGTGKTMVAGLIAQELGLDLYMVDLSQIVSKWVGETEKHLGRVFDAAAAGNVLLLFDEADALFAQRTEVKSSNDRYANLEVNFLLTKLEQFPGVAILTTNLEGSVDPAFRRRLAAHVRFYAPEERERELLWRRMIPGSAPVDPNVDFAILAKRYEDLSGGHIRNSVLRAAFLAAAADRPISQTLLDRAAVAEYREMGKIS